jgi:hypothetical protein
MCVKRYNTDEKTQDIAIIWSFLFLCKWCPHPPKPQVVTYIFDL